jgi:hypothetical protein
MEDDEKGLCCLIILFPDFERIPQEFMGEALEKAREFIDAGIKNSDKPKPSTMDWNHDAPILIPAINRVLGKEVRAVEYLHWWTFLGAYMEIGKSLFSSVVAIRKKQMDGEKLDDEEKKFLRENKSLVYLPRQERSEEEKAALRALIGKR